MISLAKLSIRRPKMALAMWLVVGIALAVIGLGVSKSLSPTITVVPGTESSRAQQLAGAQFGPTQLVPILLEGPKAELNREGPPLVAALAKRPYTRVLSAWDAGSASASLRPNPGAAMVVVSVDRSEKNVVKYDQPAIENLVSTQIKAPVSAYITGQPSIDRAEKNASLSNLRRNELIAVGILFVLLLLGLRTPVAAFLVTAVGAVSTLAAFGEVALLGRIFSLDPVGVAAGTMTGLALSVAFALLILDRFHREEFPDGVHPRDPATAAVSELRTTGRAVLVAGTAVALGLALVAVVGPTQLLVSVGTGALTCALFAIGGAVVVMPAALVLLGRRIEWLRFPAPPPLARLWTALVNGGNWVTRRAVYAGAVATALLGAIAVPAFALKSGPTDITQLPASSKARIAFQEVSRVMGPGWATPYSMIVVSTNQPVTTPALLASLYSFETQIAKDNRVDTVTGPGSINKVSKQLSSFGPQLRHSAAISEQSKKDLLKLIDGLGQAGSGSQQLQSGLAQAASGAGELHGGTGQASSGADQLHTGLAQAQAGSKQLQDGLNEALSGANALKSGASQALSGSAQITSGLGQAAPQVTAGLPAVGSMTSQAQDVSGKVQSLAGQASSMQGQIGTALSELQGMSAAAKDDPKYGAVVSALNNASGTAGSLSGGLSGIAPSAQSVAALAGAVSGQVSKLAPGLNQLYQGSQQLQGGIQQLRDGNTQLASGLAQLAGGGGQLSSGLTQLTNGAGALQVGLGQLDSGAGQLAVGLSGGVGPAGQLTTGLGTMQAAVIKARGQVPSTAQLRQLQSQSPGIFNSGYFVLAAVEGATPADRNAATFTINLLRGGTAAQIVVVSKYKLNDPRTNSLGSHLDQVAQSYAKANGLQIAVGGPAGSLGDLTSVTKSRIWVDVAVLAAAILLVLMLALRAVVLPLVSTAFSGLVAAASFGVLQLLFGGSHPPLGGPGYLDPITIISVFALAFTITIVFSTILLMRTREAFVAGAENGSAVREGLRGTAAATTGAGIVMLAAIIPFTVTDLLNVRALGIGVAVAILLDILIVRPVLLPTAEAVLGRFGWWPTRGSRPAEPGAPVTVPRRTRLHMPNRRPGAVH